MENSPCYFFGCRTNHGTKSAHHCVWFLSQDYYFQACPQSKAENEGRSCCCTCMCTHTHGRAAEKHFVSQWTLEGREWSQMKVRWWEQRDGVKGHRMREEWSQQTGRCLLLWKQLILIPPGLQSLCVSRSEDNAPLKLMLSGLIKADSNKHMGSSDLHLLSVFCLQNSYLVTNKKLCYCTSVHTATHKHLNTF